MLAFYELALRGYFRWLPSLFKIAFKLHQKGILTIGTVVWLASSLPTDFLGGLGVISGVAMHTTAAIAGEAAILGNAPAGAATGLVGDAAKTVTQGIHLLNPGGLNGAAALAGGATQAVAGGLSIVKNGQTAVAENIAHIVSAEHAISSVPLVPKIAKDAIGATQAAATENAAKFANVLESVNPLHVHLIPTASLNSQKPHVSGEQNNSASELVPDVARGPIQTLVGDANAVPGAAAHPTANPLAATGATQAAATENVAKVTHVLNSVNPLHLNIGTPAAQRNSVGSLLQPKLPGLT